MSELYETLTRLNDAVDRAVEETNSLRGRIHSMVIAFNNYECAGPVQEQENTWEILRDIMHEELLKMEGIK